VSWTFAVRERAHSLRGLVFETREKLVKLVDAESFQEPFADGMSQLAQNDKTKHALR